MGNKAEQSLSLVKPWQVSMCNKSKRITLHTTRKRASPQEINKNTGSGVDRFLRSVIIIKIQIILLPSSLAKTT